MLTIDWIRHTSLHVTGAICYGHTDLDVSESFPQEAALVKEKLEGKSYDKAFSSPLQRARKLAEFSGLNFELDERLMERDFGSWEMRPWEEIFEELRAQDDATDYRGHLELTAPPGGETVNQLIGRVGEFILDMQRTQEGRIAVFCHGGVVNSARFLNGDLDLEHLFVDVPNYGSITSIEYPTLK